MAVSDELIELACDELGVDDQGELKTGGQKVVRAVQRDSEDLVLKVVEIGSSSPEALRRAQREVELLAALDNPHVVKVASRLVELGDPIEGAAWLEEFLDGDDLAEMIGDPWDWKSAGTMACEVALGVGAMHEARVVHRDLSASNVRRRSDGTYCVMDPGFARHELRSGLTMGGQPGTPGFVSPEHLHGYSGKPTAFSDVFSIGILLFLALTGDLPIPYGGDLADYVRRLSTGQISRVEDYRSDLSPEQVSVIRRCLHRRAPRRYLNGRALAEALEPLL